MGPACSEVESAPTGSQAFPPALAKWGAHCLLFLFLFGWTALLWSRSLSIPLLFDDYNLLYWGTVRTPPFLADLIPLENGFWRPLPLAASRLLHGVSGAEPWPFHLFSIAFHATTAWWTFRLGTRLGSGTTISVMAAMLCASHAAAYVAVAQFQNVGDVLLGLAAVGAVSSVAKIAVADRSSNTATDNAVPGVLDEAMERRNSAPGAPLLLWTVLAVGSKETGLVIPALLCSCIAFGVVPFTRLPKRTRGWLAAVLLVAGICLVWALTRQITSPLSYVSGGRVIPGLHAPRKLLDMFIALLFPAAEATPFPGMEERMANYRRPFRAGMLLLVAVGLWFAWRRQLRTELFLFSCIVLLFLMPSFMATPTAPRFLYPAIPFFCLLLVRLISRLRFPGFALPATVAVFALFHLPLFYDNFHIRDLAATGQSLEGLTRAMEQVEDRIADHSVVHIQGHPYGTRPSRWPFAQFWIRVRFPEKSWNHRSSACPPDFGYPCRQLHWDGSILTLDE